MDRNNQNDDAEGNVQSYGVPLFGMPLKSNATTSPAPPKQSNATPLPVKGEPQRDRTSTEESVSKEKEQIDLVNRLTDQQKERKMATVEEPAPSPQINCLALLANVVLLLGYSFNLWFQYYEYNRCDRETIAIVVYFIAFALLILSGIMELCVDALSVRTVGHGRYHAHSAFWNGVISITFVTAGMLDVVSFIFWMEKMKGEEKTVLLISAYVLFVAATLALTFSVLEAKKISWSGTMKPDRIDLMANGLFFVTAAMGIVLRHVQFAQAGSEEATNDMELIIVPLFLFCSILYVIADGHRWNRFCLSAGGKEFAIIGRRVKAGEETAAS